MLGPNSETCRRGIGFPGKQGKDKVIKKWKSAATVHWTYILISHYTCMHACMHAYMHAYVEVVAGGPKKAISGPRVWGERAASVHWT